MTFNTRRTMLPTVVSDGWAAVILWPSVRIRSMSSPKRGEGLGYRCPEQAHACHQNQCTPLNIPRPAAAPAQGPQHQETRGKGEQRAAGSTGGFCSRKQHRLGKTASSVGLSSERGNRMLLERSVLGLTPLRGEQGWSRAALRVMRPVSTTGWEGLRRGRTSTGNLLARHQLP